MPQPGNGLRLLIILVTNKCWNVCLQQSAWKGMQILLCIFFISVRLQWQRSPALGCCAFQQPCRALGWVGQAANQQIHSSPGCWAKSKHPWGHCWVWWSLLPHRSPLLCSASLGHSLWFIPLLWMQLGKQGWGKWVPGASGSQQELDLTRLWPGTAGSALGREQSKHLISSPFWHPPVSQGDTKCSCL